MLNKSTFCSEEWMEAQSENYICDNYSSNTRSTLGKVQKEIAMQRTLKEGSERNWSTQKWFD